MNSSQKPGASEKALIECALQAVPDHVLRTEGLIVPVGDDAAVIRLDRPEIVVSVDTMVEGTHFRFDFCSPDDIGVRLIESAASDIVAMGAMPRAALIALSMPTPDTDLVRRIYHGAGASLDRLKMGLAGGDVTGGVGELVLSATVFGEMPEGRRPFTRDSGQVGAPLYLTGPIGGSAAGLAALEASIPGFEGLKHRYRAPKCRVDLVGVLPEGSRAMIDTSDGLYVSLQHLCEDSECGASIEQAKLPVDPEVLRLSDLLGRDAADWIVYGGEDFELLFSLPRGTAPPSWARMIGSLTTEEGIRLLGVDGVERTLASGGFDHFS